MIVLVLFAVLPAVVLAQDCCMPLQSEAYQGVYFGFTLRNVPGFEPTTTNGITKLVYDYVNQRQYTDYISLEVNDQKSVLGDYALDGSTTTRFYTTYNDGSCFYEDFENTLMIPPCWELIWPRVAEYTFGMDIPAATYGDVTLNNYVTVQLPGCNPLLNIATRRNAPEEGVYRWETSAFLNMTEGITDGSVLEPPPDCQPQPNPTKLLPPGLHYIKT